MKRTLHHRAAAFIWLIAFVLSTAGDGFGLLNCPHHEAGGSDSHAAEHTDGHGHRQGASHAESADHTAPAGHGAEAAPHQHDDAVPCTCGPTCQATMATALAVVPRTEPAPVAVVEQHLTPVGEAAPAAPRPPYSLPFAQGPPLHG